MDKTFYQQIGKIGGAVKHNNAVQKYYENPHHCRWCGEVIQVLNNESPSVTRKRVFCSDNCKSLWRQQNMKGNTKRKYEYGCCLNCGLKLTSHRSIYCSNQCQLDYQYKEYIQKWKSGLVDGVIGKNQLSGHIKRYIKEKYNNQCVNCGWHSINPKSKLSPLEVHHNEEIT